MKNTGQCPKCESRDLIRVPGVAKYGAGNTIVTGVFSAVAVTRFVCSRCGYSEEWIESEAELEKLRKSHV